mgnify:CR=1 FL=1
MNLRVSTIVLVLVVFFGGLATMVILVLTDTIDAGIRAKTAWDWMAVLAVPIAVALIAVSGAVWAQFQARGRASADQQLNDERQEI